jgi:AsmA protein
MKDVSMTVTARKGVIRLHPLKASLYQGKYSGDMTFNLQGRIPKITTMEELKKIQVGQLLKDLIGERKISGTANVSVRLTTRGRTDWALRRALNGNVSFSVTDGRLRGLTIPVVKVDNRSIHEEAASKTVKKTNWTDFSVARGTVWIKKGVARNNDFDFISTTVKANGKGHADLIAEQLDYLLYVQIPSLATFPIRIHGPFSKPETKLQVGEMIKVNLIGMGKDLKETFKKSRDSIEDIGEGVRDMFIGIFH